MPLACLNAAFARIGRDLGLALQINTHVYLSIGRGVFQFILQPLAFSLPSSSVWLRNKVLEMSSNRIDVPAVVISSIFVPLACAAVILRFVARRKTKASLGVEDFWAVVSLICYILQTGMDLAGSFFAQWSVN